MGKKPVVAQSSNPQHQPRLLENGFDIRAAQELLGQKVSARR